MHARRVNGLPALTGTPPLTRPGLRLASGPSQGAGQASGTRAPSTVCPRSQARTPRVSHPLTHTASHARAPPPPPPPAPAFRFLHRSETLRPRGEGDLPGHFPVLAPVRVCSCVLASGAASPGKCSGRGGYSGSLIGSSEARFRRALVGRAGLHHHHHHHRPASTLPPSRAQLSRPG